MGWDKLVPEEELSRDRDLEKAVTRAGEGLCNRPLALHKKRLQVPFLTLEKANTLSFWNAAGVDLEWVSSQACSRAQGSW